MTKRPARRVLQRLGTALLVAGMANGSMAQRAHQATGDLMLDRSVTIVVSSAEPGPVRLAAEDLAGDFAKVLGTRPNIVTRVEDAGQQRIVVGELGQLPPAMPPKGLSAPESFSIAAAGGSGSTHTEVPGISFETNVPAPQSRCSGASACPDATRQPWRQPSRRHY